MEERFAIKLILLAFAAILIIGLLIPPSSVKAPSFSAFKSYDELEDFVKSSLALYRNQGAKPFGESWSYGVVEAKSFESSSLRYSTTNVQVAGVDEADLVKTDGDRIYSISKGKVCIVKAQPLELISEVVVDGDPIGLFIRGNRLVVLCERQFRLEDFISVESYKSIMPMVIAPTMKEISIEVYDISSVENLKSIKRISLSGWYVGSRMIEDCVYVVASQPLFEFVRGELVVLRPSILVNEVAREVPPSEIYYSKEAIAPSSYAIVVAFNVFEDEALECKAILTGRASCMYASSKNIYITMLKWEEGMEFTEVHRMEIRGAKISYKASGQVMGRILNQFSMDEHEGYFRIATLTRYANQSKSSTNLYVLKVEDLKIVGKVEGLAPGEEMRSARFIGELCYLVTFKKIDPLFAIDLRDPENPKVLGELKISGYSDYLHPYGEDHLLGIGKEAVPAEEGDFAWHQGVKISLFDVSNPDDPREVDKIVIGDRGTETLVLMDHHALLLDERRGLLIMPILEARISPEKYAGKVPPWAYGDYVFQGVYVFHVSPEDGIKIKGRIAHLEEFEPLKIESYEVKRSLIIGDLLYTISEGKVKANSLIDLSDVWEIKL